MLIAREKAKIIISYVDYSKFYHVIRSFSDLNETFGKEVINFPLPSSSIAIEWLKSHLNRLDQFVDRIDTSMYEDFRINIKSINYPNISKLGF